MYKKFIAILMVVLCASISINAQHIQSPDKKLTLEFNLSSSGEPAYQLLREGKPVILPSTLGVKVKNVPNLMNGFSIIKVDTLTFKETWQPVWGEVKNIINHYRELAVTLKQSQSNVLLIARFRIFNDGIGLRYEFPVQENLKHFILEDEKTNFHLTDDHKVFWIPGDYDTNEYPYSTSTLSTVDASVATKANEIATHKPIANNAVQTPLMMVGKENLYLNIHEAALLNYPAMHLEIDQKKFILTSHLAPDAVGNKAYLQTPAQSPWRTVVVGRTGADILNSKLILNLNEPTKLTDVSWIKPQKFVGVWWEMHVGVGTWNYSDETNLKLESTNWSALKPNGKHSANTTNVKRYIDFAAKNGFDGVLVEGWNVGWEDWFGQWKEDVFDFVTPYPDFDVEELSKYGASKNVKVIMHHETSGSVTNYERRLDDAIAFMKKNNYNTVKTGYVGRIIPRGEFHDGQWMINHYTRVAKKLGENKIMLDAHEPVRPTGLSRTYPNWIASEAARGNEFNAWSHGSPPEHETILPFTRLMGGPMDYTPGIFQIKVEYYNPSRKEQVHTTLVKQLALYVTMYSPFQMVADLPQNYERFPDAFQFIKDVAVDWDDTKVLEAEPGDYITIARKAKGKEEWYAGAITDEQARTATINFHFLDPKKTYTVTLYADGVDTHWEKNPMTYEIKKYLVTQATVMKVKLAAGGGAALSIKPSSKEELKQIKRYK